jgi:phospholipase/lecithinase/hemolysin
MQKFVLRASAAIVLGALATAGAADAANYPAIYAFGDSLSDTGNDWIATNKAIPISPPYAEGRFSNGPVWVEDLSLTYGPGVMKPSLGGGTDFAYGGAESGPTLAHQVAPYDLPGQLLEFGATVQNPNPDALYTVWVGANDLIDIVEKPGLTQTEISRGIDQIISNQTAFIKSIALLGAKHVLVVDLPDFGKTPEFRRLGSAKAAFATLVTTTYDRRLIATMSILAKSLSLEIKTLDTLTLIDDAIAFPAKYNLKHVKSPCWSGDYTSSVGTVCSATVAGQDRFLFWDTLHPTAHAHAFVAAAAATTLGLAVAPAITSDSIAQR